MTFFGMLPSHILHSECHNLFSLPLKHFKHLPTLFTKTGPLDAPRVGVRGRRTLAFRIPLCTPLHGHAHIHSAVRIHTRNYTRSHRHTYTQPFAHIHAAVRICSYTRDYTHIYAQS